MSVPDLEKNVDPFRGRRQAYRLVTALSVIALAAVVIWLSWKHLAGEQERIVEIRRVAQKAEELGQELTGIHLGIDAALRSTAEIEPALVRNLASIATRLGALAEHGRSIEAAAPLLLPALQRRGEWFSTLAQRRLEGLAGARGDQEPAAIHEEYNEVYRALLGDLQTFEHSLRDLAASRVSRSSMRLAYLFTGSIGILTLLLVALVLPRPGKERYRETGAHDQASSLRSELHSQKMEAVGRLAGGIAHDLNNYLAVITAHSELVRMEAEPDGKIASKMSKVISTAEKATALLRQLLNFSHQKPAMTAVVDLNEVVRGLDPMLHRLVGEGVALEVELESDLNPVDIDPSQMEQIVVNLVVNAREAMPKGGRIVLSTWNAAGRIEGSSSKSDLVVLSVADDGPGVPEEIRERIFEPYFSTKAGAGSSGLGLATVYGIASQNRGDVQLGRGLGGGARFDVRLPRTEKTVVLGPATRGPARGASGRERILLVEDSEDLRLATEEMLRRLGYDVRSAAEGREALRIFDDEPGELDLVISDVVMAGMGGPELAAAIRERDSEVPVLLVSGYRDSTIFKRNEPADVEFLAKPFTAKVLDGRIRELLDSD